MEGCGPGLAAVAAVTGGGEGAVKPRILSADRGLVSLLRCMSAPTLSICLLLVASAGPANGGSPEAQTAAGAYGSEADAGAEGAYDDRELVKRLFALVEGIRRKNDVSRKIVEKAMARKLARDQLREETYVLAERTKGGKAYRIELEEENEIDRNIWITLDAHSSTADSSGCILDFSSFHQEMERIGYDGSRMIDHHGPGNGWSYARSGIYIRAYYRYGAYYAPGEDLTSKNLCVETVTIN